MGCKGGPLHRCHAFELSHNEDESFRFGQLEQHLAQLIARIGMRSLLAFEF